MTSLKIPAKAKSGSPPSGEPVYLVVGYLRHAHGLRGEVFMDLWTDFPERLQPGTKVYVGEEHRAMIILNQRPHRQGMLVSFEGLETREQAAEYRNQLVYVPAADRPPLPKGEYYHHQLVGLHVVEENGQSLGELTEILETGANDVYVVNRPGSDEILLPAIPSVVLDVDLERGEMRVHLLPGLAEESIP